MTVAKATMLYVPIIIATISGFAAARMIGNISAVMAGMGAVSFILGLRHGLDADHIVAIDNTVRKMMQDGKRPLTVGTWFSLGHSTVVVGLIVGLIVSAKVVTNSIPLLQSLGSVIGTGISGLFLYLIGLINLMIVIDIYKTYKRIRNGNLDPKKLEILLNKRGMFSRYYSNLFQLVKPQQIYFIGLLFGLGFDTASEIALIAMSIGLGVLASVPIWMVLTLPLLFTCGMVLVDTTDNILVFRAYSWAFLKPIRKIYYNLTITIISVLVAFLIGTIEIIQVISNELGFVSFQVDFETFGSVIIGIFTLGWATSLVIYKVKNLDSRGVVSV